jgi:hypothetical protein
VSLNYTLVNNICQRRTHFKAVKVKGEMLPLSQRGRRPSPHPPGTFECFLETHAKLIMGRTAGRAWFYVHTLPPHLYDVCLFSRRSARVRRRLHSRQAAGFICVPFCLAEQQRSSCSPPRALEGLAAAGCLLAVSAATGVHGC